MVERGPEETGVLDRPRPAPTTSVRLRRKIQLVTPPFAEACRSVFTHPRIRELWAEYLVTQHAIIRTTVPLMEAGRDRARTMAGDDPVAAGVEDYLDVHIGEERNHDDWLLDDLEVIGVSRAEALARVPSPTVASLAGSQYYWTLHYHPVALLGYFAFMEGFPPQPRLIQELIERTGHPEAAFRTFVLHGELDPGHQEELDRTIDVLPVTDDQENVLGLSAMSTAALVSRSLQEVARSLPGA
jgi:Iron-containing redox enzyme